jgi:ATP-binding cassette subfamily G (WHITE) protein 2 (PDR)
MSIQILTLYDQRPIVEKQWRYALYHPSAEAIASMITDIPYKVTNAVVFNLTIYFMANLRRAPGPFFFLVLVSFISTFALSSIYRTIASMSRTMAQAMVPAGLLTLGLIMFTGFTIPVAYMRGWSRWMNYINPLAYAFEALMVNEFSGRDFQCSLIIPSGAGYGGVDAAQHTCAVPGSTLGSMTVQGEAYIASSFRYHSSHKWRYVTQLSSETRR